MYSQRVLREKKLELLVCNIVSTSVPSKLSENTFSMQMQGSGLTVEARWGFRL